jgi:hypothetical protein
MIEHVVKYGELGQGETGPDRSVSFPIVEKRLNVAREKGLRLIAVAPTSNHFGYVFFFEKEVETRG